MGLVYFQTKNTYFRAYLNLKTNIVKQSFLLLIALMLFSCQPPVGGPIEGTVWKLTYMNGDIPEGIDVSARFDNGKVTGKGICNRYFADYETDSGQLKIGPVGATKMLCPDNAMLESQYFGTLSKAQSYSVNGEKLSITCEGAKLQFVKGEENKAIQ